MLKSTSCLYLFLLPHSSQNIYLDVVQSLDFPGGSVVKKPPASAEDSGSTPGLGRSPEKEMAAHSSILAWKNTMDIGAWWAIVQWVTKELDMTKQLSAQATKKSFQIC